MKRRKFIKYSLSTVLGSTIVAGFYTWQIEPFWLEFVYRQLPIKNLPNRLKGKTLMQISDVHVGNQFDYQFIIESFKRASALSPDIVVYTGDYMSYEGSNQFNQMTEVFKNAVHGQLGTYAILGNHDYGFGWKQNEVAQRVCQILNESRIQILRNEIADCYGLDIMGLDDYWAINFNPGAALGRYKKSKASLVLCHNPDVCDLNVWGNYEGWILSGHTHGGQCKPPFLKAPMLPVKNKNYDQGYIALGNNRHLYINRALGHLHQVRFNVRPEITVFTLV